ncbi:flagellar export protein FliJ [Parathalassolituus penaei]|uniref:Flagellar FliJ protein n=1 Tax=Parathalassolituus penaei TaxID=2997323 RepID=A0A9X3IS73_9GAMM|nr:flagellar export protein FliJ [Parathalassolituus penaei]MCY0966037.1 flagellar export protein FliJ [Parathalassolituus penaei]
MNELPQPRHPRGKRLLPVYRQAQQQQQQALADWGQLQQKLLEEEEQRQQLLEYADDYRRQITAPSTGLIQAATIHNTLGFLAQVEQAVQGQAQQINLLKARIERAREVYLTKRGKTDGLQRLIDKLDREWEEQQQKAEQRQADEWANRAAFQRLQQGNS